MVIGESTKTETLEINVCKTKQLTNMRAAGKDDGIVLAPPRTMVRPPIFLTPIAHLPAAPAVLG